MDVEIRVGGGGGRRMGLRRAAGKGGTVEFAGLVENVRPFSIRSKKRIVNNEPLVDNS